MNGNISGDEWVKLELAVKIAGRPIEVEMTVPARPVKPHRILPVFHQMTNAFVGMGARDAESRGEKISCKAGCGACCRQPVPLAEVEVYQIAELVEAMPDARQTEIRRRFSEANSHFHKMKWFDAMKRCADSARRKSPDAVMKEIENLVNIYFREGIACPFLENESCSIHNSRPIACREYLVTSPAENCANPKTATVHKVDVAARVSKLLQPFGDSGRLNHMGFLPLIRALEIADEFPETFAEKSGPDWIRDFFGIGETPAATGADSRRKRRRRRPVSSPTQGRGAASGRSAGLLI